jgi:hypothetical protein
MSRDDLKGTIIGKPQHEDEEQSLGDMIREELPDIKRKRGFLCIGGPALLGGVISGLKGELPTWKLRLAFMLVAPLTGGFLGAGYLLAWLFLDKE